MAFAVEPYIFDWIFFDDSSLSKLGGLELQGERQQNVPLGCISLPPIGSVYAIYLRRGLSVLLIRVIGSQDLDMG